MAELTNYQGPGIYLHFKGGLYGVLGLAVREESIGLVASEQVDVVYCPLEPYDREEQFVTRSLHVFDEQVPAPLAQGRETPAGRLPTPVETARPTVPRFQKVSS